MFSYKDYIQDRAFLDQYHAYQKRYVNEPRESDKVLIDRVRALVREDMSILDIGCSTGNLLRHLRRALPKVRLVGGDLAESALEACVGIRNASFEVMDILDIQGKFDIIIANAVLYMLDDDEYERALKSIFAALRDNGVCLVFDFAHDFARQKLVIHETSPLHPEGLRLTFRSRAKIREIARGAGFSSVSFQRFYMPFALAFPENGDLVSYTDASRSRIFRGALYQPWCHIEFKK